MSEEELLFPEPFEYTCFCGKCSVQISGEPKFAGFCHCKECRVKSCCAINEALAFPPDKVTLMSGEDVVKEFVTAETRKNTFCGECGQQLFNTNKFGLCCLSVANLFDNDSDSANYGNILNDNFKPTCHIYYDERITDCAEADGLPKFLDLPESFGGTGKLFEPPSKAAPPPAKDASATR